MIFFTLLVMISIVVVILLVFTQITIRKDFDLDILYFITNEGTYWNKFDLDLWPCYFQRRSTDGISLMWYITSMERLLWFTMIQSRRHERIISCERASLMISNYLQLFYLMCRFVSMRTNFFFVKNHGFPDIFWPYLSQKWSDFHSVKSLHARRPY